jgi:ketosteroid isomerase-like protein
VGQDRKAKNFAPIVDRLAATRTKLPAMDAAQMIATIEDQIAAIGRGDFEATLRHTSPDVELEIYAPPEFPFINRARGAADLLTAIRHNFDAVVDQQPVISNVLVQDDVVVMLGAERGRIRATGAAYHVQFVHRFTFDAGTIKNIRIIAARAT